MPVGAINELIMTNTSYSEFFCWLARPSWNVLINLQSCVVNALTVFVPAWRPKTAGQSWMHGVPKAVNVWLYRLLPHWAECVNGKFSSDRRIVKTDDFSSVFRMRPCARTEHFVLYARSNQLAHARLGIVVAKRFAPRAVTRNTVKRICREVFRCMQMPALDCIIRMTSPVNTRRGPATGTYLKRALREEVCRLMASRRKAPKSWPWWNLP